MARLPDGALMQRAAAGLATSVIDLLGGVYGARVLLLVGSGDNGGDALYAGADARPPWSAGRGAAARRPGARGRPGRAAGGRRSRRAVGWPSSARRGASTGSSASVAAPACRQPALDAVRAVAGVPVVAVDVPSGVDVDTGGSTAPHVTRRRHRHLRHPQDRPPGRAGRVGVRRRPARRPRPRPAGRPGRGTPGRRRGRPAARPDAERAEVHPRRRRRPGRLRRATPAPACCRTSRRGLRPGRDGAVRRARRPTPSARGTPRSSSATGRVQAWVVGSGGDDDAADALSAALADGVPLVVDADALPAPPGAARGARAPDAPRRRARRDARRRAGGGRGRPARPSPAARRGSTPRSCCSRAGTRWSRAPNGRVRVTTTGMPWLAVAGAGDVLGGLFGSLLAAGLAPYDAGVGRLLAARRGRHPGLAGAARSPLADVAAALPG